MVDAVVSTNHISHKCSANVGVRQQVPSDLTKNKSSNAETKTDVAYYATGAAKFNPKVTVIAAKQQRDKVCRPYNF